MMAGANLPSNLWGEAIMAATYLLNRSPTSALRSTTPCEMYYGRKPNISNLRVWGCKAYVHKPKELRSKLDSRCSVGAFVGYDTNGYRIYNPETYDVIIARHVTFDESIDNVTVTPNTTTNAQPPRVIQSSENLIDLG